MFVHCGRKLLPVFVLLACFSMGSVAAGDEVAQARDLMQRGKPGEAYSLLEKLEFERAGDVDFDYQLGIAALDSGKPDKATLAFERVLAINPNSAGARMDMARAYFALGDYSRSRQELQRLSELNPPPAAKLAIEQYLSAIEEKERAKRTAITGYLEGFAGNDNNITSVVGDFTNAVLATYNLPGFQPTGSAIKRSSAILGAAGGMEVNHHIDDAMAVFAGADARYRGVQSAGNNYSSEQIDGRAGVSYTHAAEVFRGGVSFQEFRQRTDTPGQSANRSSTALNGEWRHTFSPADQAGLVVVLSRQRFPDIPVNDIDTQIVGANWLHLFDSERKPLLFASLLGGQDDARNKLLNGADNSKRFWGLRLVGQISFDEDIDWFAGLGLMRRDDRAMNARSPLVAYGADRMADFSLGLNWRPAKNWTVRPQVTYSENRSNVAVSEYQRTEVNIAVRYDFH